DYYRKEKIQYSVFDQLKTKAIEENEKEDNELTERRIQRLKETIDTLPYRCKRILEMNKIEGLKYREISEILGISVKTVESQMRIAFQKIREAFKDEELFLFFLSRTFKNEKSNKRNGLPKNKTLINTEIMRAFGGDDETALEHLIPFLMFLDSLEISKSDKP